jgi:hypothetical protein
VTHLGVVSLCAVIAGGCGGPAGPSPFTRPPTPVPVASPNPVADIRIRGLVLDDASRPVSNARIGRPPFHSGGMVGVSPVLSSSDGAFEFLAAGWSRELDVTVDKESFETSIVRLSWPEAQAGDTVTTNLRLHAIVRIPAGESARLTIVDQRLQCSDDSESLPACRTIRVRADRAGRLVLETRAPFVLSYAGWSSEQLHVDVASPGEVIVNVALLDPPPQEATIATRLEPR